MQNLDQTIYKYLKERNWHNVRPADLAKSVMIEGAELLEHFQWDNLSLEEVNKKSKAEKEEIASEIADVMIYCIELSVLMGFDTEKIITKKLAKVKKKYPIKLIKQPWDKLSKKTTNQYWKIKKAHRQKKK